MLPHLTMESSVRRKGLDDGYHGRPQSPPIKAQPFLNAYLLGYQSGQNQRRLEVRDGTHHTLFPPTKRRTA